MRQYADFDFYKDTFRGTVLNDKGSFDRMAIEASFYINEITLGRIDEPVIDEVKMATCAVAEIVHSEYVQQNDDQVASESVGPHSVSYVKKTKTTQEFEKEKIRKARMYLRDTGLLYRGIPSCCF